MDSSCKSIDTPSGKTTVYLSTTIFKQFNSFLNGVFPSYFHITIDINFTFHPQLYVDHTLWINDILPIFTHYLYFIPFEIYLCFLYRVITRQFPLVTFHSQIQGDYLTWLLYIYTLSFSSVGSSISCFRSPFYVYLYNLPSDSSLQISSNPSFSSTSTWLSPLLIHLPSVYLPLLLFL